MLEIVDNRQPAKVEFKETRVGDVFRYMGFTCIKVPQIFDNSETICYNAVGLNTGNLFYIAQNCLIEKIPKAKLILE